MEKENIWSTEEKRTEREKEEKIWRREIFRKGKYLVRGERKYLEKENIWPAEEMRMEKEKEEIIRSRKNDGDVDRPTNRVDIVQYAFSNVRQKKAEICS